MSSCTTQVKRDEASAAYYAIARRDSCKGIIFEMARPAGLCEDTSYKVITADGKPTLAAKIWCVRTSTETPAMNPANTRSGCLKGWNTASDESLRLPGNDIAQLGLRSGIVAMSTFVGLMRDLYDYSENVVEALRRKSEFGTEMVLEYYRFNYDSKGLNSIEVHNPKGTLLTQWSVGCNDSSSSPLQRKGNGLQD